MTVKEIKHPPKPAKSDFLKEENCDLDCEPHLTGLMLLNACVLLMQVTENWLFAIGNKWQKFWKGEYYGQMSFT